MRLLETTASADSCIAVLIADLADRRRVINALAPLARVCVCQSLQDLQAILAKGAMSGVICECRDSYGLPLGPGLASVEFGLDVPTLIFMRPTASDVSFFSDLVRRGVPALARVTGQADIGDVVRSVIKRRWFPEATAPIIRHIAGCLATPLEMTLVIAMIAGSIRLDVNTFARLAGVSERTLQRRLAVAGLPSASRLLTIALTLHSAWRLEIRGDRVKEVVAASGFTTREAFTSFIRRHASCNASDLSQQGAFHRLLEGFVAELLRGVPLNNYADLKSNH